MPQMSSCNRQLLAGAPLFARFKPNRPLRRKVAIRRDVEDFVIAFQPEDTVVFRHAEATALRKACVFLRWEVSKASEANFVSGVFAKAERRRASDSRYWPTERLFARTTWRLRECLPRLLY